MEISDHQGEASASTSAGNVAGSTTVYCLPCALTFTDPDVYTLHIKSDEHANMVLITGVSDVEQEELLSEFPPLYYCILCRVYKSEFGFYRYHLMGTVHKKMAQHLRNISFFNDTILIGMKWKKDLETAEDYEDLKLTLPNYCKVCDRLCNSDITFRNHIEGKLHKKYAERVKSCDICNISYVRPDAYESHLKSELHETLKEFRELLSMPESEITGTPEKEECKPLVLRYFCKLCSIKFNSLQLFRNHRNISTHRRIHHLVRKMSMQKNISNQVAEICEKVPVSMHYCELCRYWCPISATETFQAHLDSGPHSMNKSRAVVQGWLSSRC